MSAFVAAGCVAAVAATRTARGTASDAAESAAVQASPSGALPDASTVGDAPRPPRKDQT
jgi:hypothetical protein